MREILAAMVLVFFLPISQPAKEGSSAIVLPNPKLLLANSQIAHSCGQTVWAQLFSRSN